MPFHEILKLPKTNNSSQTAAYQLQDEVQGSAGNKVGTPKDKQKKRKSSQPPYAGLSSASQSFYDITSLGLRPRAVIFQNDLNVELSPLLKRSQLNMSFSTPKLFVAQFLLSPYIFLLRILHIIQSY
jgi:hypothetical protein